MMLIDTTRDPKSPERAVGETIVLVALPLVGFTMLAFLSGNLEYVVLGLIGGSFLGFILGFFRKALFIKRLNARTERRTKRTFGYSEEDE